MSVSRNTDKAGKQTRADFDPCASVKDTPSIMEECRALFAPGRAWIEKQRNRARGIVQDTEAVLEVLDNPENITLTQAVSRIGSLLKRFGL